MMVPFESLTILAACLIIGRLCFVLEAGMFSKAEESRKYNVPNPSPDGSHQMENTSGRTSSMANGVDRADAASRRSSVCVEITASPSCSCIIHKNNPNGHPTINHVDKLETCTIIVYTNTSEEAEKCSFNITTPNKKWHHCKTNFVCPGNNGTHGRKELHFCMKNESIICDALAKEICTTQGPWNRCCSSVSPTDSPNTSPLTESFSIESSLTESLDDTSSGSDLPTSSSASSEQASVTVTTTAAAKTSSTHKPSGKSTAPPHKNIPGSQSTNAGDPLPFTGAIYGTTVIGVLLILVIAVVLVVILFRRYKRGNRVSVDNIETTTGERNPAYSLVQGTFSPAHDSTHPHSTNVYSEAPSQKPITPPNSNDTVLVDNELYGHQPQQNFPTEAVPRLKANAAVDSSQQQSVYSLVQRTSTSDASLQPLHPTSSSSQKPSTNDNDRILVENDLYGCQQTQSSTYEAALPASQTESVGNAQTTTPTRYSLVRPVSTADDPVQPPATTDTCSAESSSAQKQPADGSDRLLVDNDLYNC